jgi:hypothetical protein
MDNSYIDGNFSFYNQETQSMETVQSMPLKTLIAIRADLLGVHGFAFEDPAIVERLKNSMPYAPLFTSLDEVLPYMSEIEKHNLAFLDELIDRLSGVV